MPTDASKDAVARDVPEGDQFKDRTVLVWPVSIVPAFLKVHADEELLVGSTCSRDGSEVGLDVDGKA
jgi:hypothetical protein